MPLMVSVPTPWQGRIDLGTVILLCELLVIQAQYYVYDPRVTQPSNPMCDSIREECSKKIADFTRCTVVYSNPLRFCCNCAGAYDEVMECGKNMTQEPDCHFFDRDKTDVVGKSFKFVQDTWSQAYCLNCFANETLVSNETEWFFHLEEEVRTCFANNTEACINGSKVLSEENDICHVCNASYNALNTFYKRLSRKYDNQVCLDIGDGMNSTRTKWNSCRCQQWNGFTDIASFVLAAVIIFSTALFYLGTRILTLKQRTVIVQQKRLHLHRASSHASLLGSAQ